MLGVFDGINDGASEGIIEEPIDPIDSITGLDDGLPERCDDDGDGVDVAG